MLLKASRLSTYRFRSCPCALSPPDKYRPFWILLGPAARVFNSSAAIRAIVSMLRLIMIFLLVMTAAQTGLNAYPCWCCLPVGLLLCRGDPPQQCLDAATDPTQFVLFLRCFIMTIVVDHGDCRLPLLAQLFTYENDCLLACLLACSCNCVFTQFSSHAFIRCVAVLLVLLHVGVFLHY